MKRLGDAIALSAFLHDADGAGYLGLEDQNAVQKARADYGFCCQRIALDLLHQHSNAIAAKSAARQKLGVVIADFVAQGADEDELIPLRQLEEHLQQVIDRQATKSEWQRNLTRVALGIPPIVWVLLVAVVVASIAIVGGTVIQG